MKNKKKFGKIKLSKETVSKLTDLEKKQIKGGAEETKQLYVCHSYKFHCFPDSIEVC